MARPLSIAFALLITGCGGPSYYEPRPATVVQAERLVHPTIRTEPTVLLVLFDLHLPDQDQCSAFQATFLSALSKPLTGKPLTRLDLQVNNNCNALAQRAVDVPLIQEKLNWAAAGYPSFAVRPVIIYVNNLDAPPPPSIRDALQKLPILPIGEQQLRPRLWGLTLQAARIDQMEQWLEWTFADDEALPDNVSALVNANLPQWSVADGEPQTLLTADERAAAEGIRLCSADPYVLTDLPADGSAMAMEDVKAVAQLTVQPQLAELASTPKPSDGKIRVELCLEACDRHVAEGDALGPVWKLGKQCVGGAP